MKHQSRKQQDIIQRRGFLQGVAVGAPLVLTGYALGGSTEPESSPPEEDVSPSEDLMREHGVLKRILLIYEEAIRRLNAGEDLPPESLADSAEIIHSFIEGYHEPLEEVYLFPRFRKANRLVDLVNVLTEQHQRGRRLTETTLKLAKLSAIKDPVDRRTLAESMRLFIRMYNPHEAREDTVLFPAFREIVTANEYDALGEDFERKEHELFGADGFEKMVDKVATIEKTLGIYDLSQFTPPQG